MSRGEHIGRANLAGLLLTARVTRDLHVLALPDILVSIIGRMNKLETLQLSFLFPPQRKTDQFHSTVVLLLLTETGGQFKNLLVVSRTVRTRPPILVPPEVVPVLMSHVSVGSKNFHG